MNWLKQQRLSPSTPPKLCWWRPNWWLTITPMQGHRCALAVLASYTSFFYVLHGPTYKYFLDEHEPCHPFLFCFKMCQKQWCKKKKKLSACICFTSYLQPLDMVFLRLPYQVDPFQHIGDVVQTPLGHFELRWDQVEVQHSIQAATKHVSELLRQENQRVIGATSVKQLFACCGFGEEEIQTSMRSWNQNKYWTQKSLHIPTQHLYIYIYLGTHTHLVLVNVVWMSTQSLQAIINS